MCQAKKGLLFLRDCGEVAMAGCHLCGRPICVKHQVPTEKGPQCSECAARASGENASATASGPGRLNPVNRARFRSRYYNDYAYVPYHFGHHSGSFYSDHDYHTFETSDQEDLAAAGAIEGADDMEFDNPDDFMES
jgi:hypothetical protein